MQYTTIFALFVFREIWKATYFICYVNLPPYTLFKFSWYYLRGQSQWNYLCCLSLSGVWCSW